MAKDTVDDWDLNPDNNTDLGGIPIGEGLMEWSSVNNAFREEMAQIAAWRDDIYANSSSGNGFVYADAFNPPKDDITDAALTLQQAIDATPDGSTLVISPARYYVSVPLVVTSRTGLTIDGNGGAIIRTDGDSDVLTITSSDGVTLKGITFRGDNDALKTAQHGVTATTTCSDIELDRCDFLELGADGVRALASVIGFTAIDCGAKSIGGHAINPGGVDATGGCENVRVAGCDVNTCGGDGIHLGASQLGAIVTSNRVANSSKAGVGAVATIGARIVGNEITACAKGVSVTGDASDWLVADNAIEGTTEDGILLSRTTIGTAYGVCRDNHIWNGAAAITASSTNWFRIGGNMIHGVIDGIALTEGAQACSFGLISDNMLDDIIGTPIFTGSNTNITVRLWDA